MISRYAKATFSKKDLKPVFDKALRPIPVHFSGVVHTVRPHGQPDINDRFCSEFTLELDDGSYRNVWLEVGWPDDSDDKRPQAARLRSGDRVAGNVVFKKMFIESDDGSEPSITLVAIMPDPKPDFKTVVEERPVYEDAPHSSELVLEAV